MENTPANWAEERATALQDNTGPRSQIHKNGHSGTVHGERTLKVAFTDPKGTRIRQKGLRAELLEKHLIKSISEQIKAELNPEPPAPELCSVTRTDYAAEGFRFVRPAPSAEETGVPRGNPHTHWENMQIPHRKDRTCSTLEPTDTYSIAVFITICGPRLTFSHLLHTSTVIKRTVTTKLTRPSRIGVKTK
ncbi:sperm associated antigen 8 isoform X1 [Trichomycterus rosablanca]|uniref:sperm associated antigen 8 isoform X1 n=1 Tax=Trichomycterus rosablanca TaxID=2290929 RepID=UPI002F34F2D0